MRAILTGPRNRFSWARVYPVVSGAGAGAVVRGRAAARGDGVVMPGTKGPVRAFDAAVRRAAPGRWCASASFTPTRATGTWWAGARRS